MNLNDLDVGLAFLKGVDTFDASFYFAGYACNAVNILATVAACTLVVSIQFLLGFGPFVLLLEGIVKFPALP